MPLRMDWKTKLTAPSDRVKSVDIHPSEPWALTALYTGRLVIHDYETGSVVKSIEASTQAIRTAKFIARQQWVICGGDDLMIRVYNYNTAERLAQFDAHSDYIRSIAVHSSLPYFLSASDDMTIRLWDWDQNFRLIQSYEAHAHYVMMVIWSPRDPQIFASASLDRCIRVWGAPAVGTTVSQSVVLQSHFILMGHERGVNCIEYSRLGDKPYLLSGSDDFTVRVWDYQTRQCIQVLTGHTRNICCVAYHPHLAIILSGSEDGTLKVWHLSTYRNEATLQHHMDRLWTIATVPGKNIVGLGYDEGSMVLSVGNEHPVVSFHCGKLIWIKNSEIFSSNLRIVDDEYLADGDRLPIAMKEIGSSSLFPQTVSHQPSGRFIALCGDGEYVVLTAQALRSKAYGNAVEFVWSSDGSYAVRDEVSQKITIFSNFEPISSFRPSFAVTEIFGGALLGVKGDSFICFFDWATTRLVRRIDVCPKLVYWSPSGDVTLACADEFYILKCDHEAISAAIAGGAPESDEGIEIAFHEDFFEVPDSITSGCWVGDTFTFLTSSLKLQTCTARQIDTLGFLEKPNQHIIGYIPETSRVYLMDREGVVISYELCLPLLNFQSAIIYNDFNLAKQLESQLPEKCYNKIASFLHAHKQSEYALTFAKDADLKFSIAIALNKLDLCTEVVVSSNDDSDSKWRWSKIGDAALQIGDFEMAKKSLRMAEDPNGLFLLASCTGDLELMSEVSQMAKNMNMMNLEFISQFLQRKTHNCVQSLIDENRQSLAVLFAKTFAPSRFEDAVREWKESLKQTQPTASKNLSSCGIINEDLINLKLLESCLLLASGSVQSSNRYEIMSEYQEIDWFDELKNNGIEQIKEALEDESDDDSDKRLDSSDECVKRSPQEDEVRSVQSDCELFSHQSSEEEAFDVS